MKITFTIILAAFQLCTFAQVVAGFENFNLEPGKYLNDASPANGFESGSIILPNNYNAEFGVWSGFAISTDTNTTTPGFLNQYSSIVGEGAIGSTAYAMGYIFDPLIIRLKEKAIGKPMIGMYVTNSTYAYLSMRDGDAFAKKFGGETGSDPDFFLLTIKNISEASLQMTALMFISLITLFKPSQDIYSPSGNTLISQSWEKLTPLF